MKTRIVIGGLLASMMALQVSAQENDDLYFKSKDREKLKVENATASVNDKIDKDYKAFKKKNFDENIEEEVAVTTSVNPTDSYSARTINPEFISRSNSAQASEDEQNYYIEGYTPVNTYDSYSAGNYNNLNSNYQNSWYGSSAYNNSWYTPYYGYCNPYMSPYYSASPGWTMSLGYTWGNMMSPGWSFGIGYGWGGSYYNPYSYYSPYGYGNYYGYPSYYNNGGYYSEASKPNYGKRPSRHSAVVTPTQRSTQRITTANNGSPSGRTRQSSDEYYVKPSRRTPAFDNTSGTYSRDRYTRPTESSNPTRTRETYNSNSRESRTTYSTPSRSSSVGGSTPSRSSGSSSDSRPSRGRD
jgi:hypothetical protein